MGHSTFFALLACLSFVAPAPESITQVPELQEQRAQLPALDAELQKSIALVMGVGVSLSPSEARAELDRLESQAGDDYGRLIPQLFLFSRKATSTREAMAFGAIVSRLRIADASVLRSLVPLLEVQDAKLQGELGGYLSEYEGEGVERRPSFEHYRDFLARPLGEEGALPAGLLRYLFERDAGQAVLLLMSVSKAPAAEQRQIRWAEHLIADLLWQEEHGYRERGTPDAQAGQELERMALHPAWYARLYALRVMDDAPHLGQRALLERLGEDEDARVRAAARRVLAKR